MAADFVDPIDVLNVAARRVQPLHRLIARRADRFGHALIDCVIRIEWEHSLASRIEDYFAERDATQLLIFVQQPGNQLVYRPLRCRRGLRQSGTR